MKQDMSIDHGDIKRVIKGHCVQLYTCIFNNVDEMDQFLEKHKLP